MEEKLRILQDEFSASHLQATQEGTARFKRLQSMAKLHRRLDDFMKWAFSLGVNNQIEQQTNLLLPVVVSHLEWTGHKGAVIEVWMKKRKGGVTPPELDRVRFLGSGDRPIDVVILFNEDAKLDQRLPIDYEWAPDAGMMMWVTKERGKYKTYVVAPGSLGAIHAKAIEDVATKNVLLLNAGVREIDTLRSIVKYLEQNIESDEVKKVVNKALEERRNIEERKKRVELELKEAIEENKRIDGAREWIELMKVALTVAELGLQTKTMLGPKTEAKITDAINGASKSISPNKLESLLLQYSQETVKRTEVLRGEQRVIIETINRTRTTIYHGAMTNGAPKTIYLPEH